MLHGRHIEIRGIVQGVGFRPWVYRVARGAGVGGRVLNDARGVVIEAFGDEAQLDRFLAGLRVDPPPAALIRELTCREIPAEPLREFVIAPSAHSDERRVSIPADLATCPRCVQEILDPHDRRFGYAFTNCTDCGPRFTIARDVPYDRAATTMAPFTMCVDCAREYRDPLNRRFHAQPNACPRCGPQLRTVPESDDPLQSAVVSLLAGRIVAVKGIGGFHLACDATSSDAVKRLRLRKRREERPFAVMVRDIDEAHQLAQLSAEEMALLTSVERPIVLVRKAPELPLADEVAPDNPLLGLMLAYSPLHHLLLAKFAGPLVMTSANASEEPIAYRDEDALARLAGIADVFLLHDRAIETRADDSIARVIAGAPTVLRRSRGYVPRAIPLKHRVEKPVLAVGADLKNTFCIATGDSAYLGPHVGDLGSLETWQSLGESIERMLRFLRVEPAIVAHDLHPDSIAASYARSLRFPRVGVQHHHAHVASAMAEHGIDGPVIGVAYDGTGYGTDGTLWGGEVLLATAADFTRLATMRPIPLAGGERAIRQVWRIALAALDDAFDGAPPLDDLLLFRDISKADIAGVRQLVAKGVNAPLARGAGRWFDAAGAIGLAKPRATYEGQVALEWNNLAGDWLGASYEFAIDFARDPIELDLRPLIRAIARDAIDGRAGAQMAAGFHDALACATAELVHAASRKVGRLPVVLTGGCFQNARLAQTVRDLLGPTHEIVLHRAVPPGDGGIALGQALVAAAQQ